MLKKLVPFIVLLSLCALVRADEADVKKGMEARLGTKVESVTKAGYWNLYEVYADGTIFYTDEKMTAIMVGGHLIDAKTMRNVTEERLKKLTAINFNELPFERAIKIVHGDGKRVMATFEDPNCGYCKRLARELKQLDNVTIYTFLYPILSEDSVHKSRQIWCSKDRAKTWSDWMLDGKLPPSKENCDTSAVGSNREFGHKLNITGTPTIFFANGERVPGAMPMSRIEQSLSAGK